MASQPDALSPAALTSSIPSFLPPSSKTLRSAEDAIAVLVHASFSAVAFRLVSISDNGSFSGRYEKNILPREWNQQGPGNYTFCYKHEQSALAFIVKLSKLGSRMIINTIASESNKAASLDLQTSDFTSSSFFPWSAIETDKPLSYGYISPYRISDLTSQLKVQIFQKLVPGLRKEGYSEVDDSSTHAAGYTSSQRPVRPTSEPQPGVPYDPLRVDQPLRWPDARNPLEIGRSDLDPIPNAPRMPRSAFAPPRLFPDYPDDDGMFVGPTHPIFSGRNGSTAGIPAGGQGPWGGDGFLPPMGAPPGARFDPIVPGHGLFPPGGFGRAPRRSGDPDNDEFMPPGMGNMYM